jgi:predicted nucleic acid-binding protein
MIVIDASVIVDAILDPYIAEAFNELSNSNEFAAPDHIFIEVLNSLRRLERQDVIAPIALEQSIALLRDWPIERFSVHELISDIWTLRHNITPYDAPYVVLAGLLNAPLLTHDEKLVRAIDGEIETLSILNIPAP